MVNNEGDPTNPQPVLYFKAEDEVSGINHYKVKIGDQDVFTLLESQIDSHYRIPLQFPGDYLIKIEAVDKAGNSTTALAKIKIESILSPEITVCPNSLFSSEEVLHIEGTAISNQTVVVSFTKGEELAKEWEVQSDNQGNWFIDEDSLFRSGGYVISAKTRDSRGAISNPSLSRYVQVTLNGIAIGPWLITCPWVIISLIVLFVALCIFLVYIFQRIKLARKNLQEETQDLKEKFYKEYSELKRGIEEELKIKKNRTLTEKDKQRQKQLLKDLVDVEDVIVKELKDIENIK